MKLFKVGDILEPANEGERITLDSYGQSPWTVVENDTEENCVWVKAKNCASPLQFWESSFKKVKLGKYFVMCKNIKDGWVDSSLSPYENELDAFKAALAFVQDSLKVKVVKREEIEVPARKEIKEIVLSL